MKKNLAIFIKKLDRFIHKNFDFLNVGKPGKFNKNYKWIYKYLENEESNLSKKSFIEVGSRDVLDSLDILSKFKFSKAYIFEASFAGIQESINNLKTNKNYLENIIFFPVALGDRDGTTDFYEYIEIFKNHSRANIGASTIYGNDNKSFIHYKVPIFKLDSININFDDSFLLLMDCEGSELPVLHGAKSVIKKLKYITLETSYSISSGNCEDIESFLFQQDFKLLDCDWPNTVKGSLPNKSDVGNARFCLIFENLNQKL